VIVPSKHDPEYRDDHREGELPRQAVEPAASAAPPQAPYGTLLASDGSGGTAGNPWTPWGNTRP
jgi:hypothetical protein